MYRSAHALRSGLLATAATLLLAMPGLAQEPPTPPTAPPTQQEISPEAQAMLDELNATQQRLEGLQQQALAESEELQQDVAGIQELVEEAVRVVEPEYDALVGRLGELQQEAMAAQQAQDQQTFQQVMMEAETIQGRLETAQEQVFEREEVSEVVESYREKLMVEMARIDPEAPELMERMDELVEQLSEILG
jgi:HD-GYP domain-containing protein (c-di-GMP phosphodiesterase class II)